MKRLNQSGAVAMISVVIFSIIITILVSAYARTIISQQREAINYDLSTRAYYAAESGVQDVIRELKNPDSDVTKNGQQNCKGASGYLGKNSSGKLGESDSLVITCQLVDLTSDGIRDVTNNDESKLWQIKADGASQIKIGWSEKASEEPYALPNDGGKLFSPTTTWSSNKYPPVIRINFIKKSGTNYEQAVYFVKPTSTRVIDDVSLDFSQTPDSKVQFGQCESDSGYMCSTTFKANGLESDIAQGHVYVVIQGVYGTADYEISPLDNAAKPVGIKNLVDIDVTARAGSVFKRVKQQVSLGGEDTYQNSWFNADALVVGDGICKLFTVGSAPSQYNTQCK